MKLLHTLDESVACEHDGIELFRYVYSPQTPALESPRPYFHPLRTLKGNIVSGFRPHDHRWHHGLSMTCAHLSGHNFWGGPTFQDGEYRQLEKNGRQFPMMEHGVLRWVNWWETQSGERLLMEVRTVEPQIEQDYWTLNWESHFSFGSGLLDLRRTEPLIWGTPTTQGREMAGYGGLFWRGPRDFLNGKILAGDGQEGPEMMGRRSPWLAYIGQHDETDDHSTLIFVDNPENPRYPTQWFVRNTTPMVCPSFMFDQEYVQQPGETLSLSYKILIADGAWSREQVEAVV